MKRQQKESKLVETLWSRTNHKVPVSVSRYIEEKVISYYAYSTKKRSICSHCGNTFDNEGYSDGETIICPHCHTKLVNKPTRKIKDHETYITQQLLTQGEYQVIRTYFSEVYTRVGRKVSIYHQHVYDWYVSETKRSFLFSVPLCMYYYRCSNPFSSGAMRLSKNASYEMRQGWYIDAIIPRKQVQPWAKRLGFGKQILKIDNYDLLSSLMTNPHIETLLKAKQYSLMKYYMARGDAFWNSVKIALRHGFEFGEVKDVETWMDYLHMLSSEGKDILNPAYICPEDLTKAHNDLVRIRNERAERERLARNREMEIQEEQKRAKLIGQDSNESKLLAEHIKNIINWSVASGDIVIEPLKSIQEFFDEGKEMHHCVFGAEYFKKDSSIILSAKVSGSRTETIEISTRDFSIVQCRGRFNHDSEYHEQIMSLMSKNISSLKRMYKGN